MSQYMLLPNSISYGLECGRIARCLIESDFTVPTLAVSNTDWYLPQSSHLFKHDQLLVHS
jgi:hypothetical protein